MECKDWNDAIAGHFFREENAGERVYLHVSQHLIRRLGRRSGIPEDSCVDDFVTAIKEKHRFSDGYSVAEVPLKWLKIENAWDAILGGSQFPPYIAHLGLFVLAAGYNPDSDFSSGSYYPRLNSLLGQEPDGSSPSGFEELQKVWEHLEKWSNRDQKGKLGIFEIQRLDQRSHVGIPRSQRLLSEQERKVARWVFSETGLDPALSPSEEEVASLMRSRGHGKLRGRTYDLLAPGSAHPKYRQALIGALMDVLNNWDGSPVEIEEVEGSQSSTGYRGTLAMSFRESFGEINLQLRCLARRNFPEGELVLQDQGANIYSCHEVMSGWSTALQDEEGCFLDPGKLDLLSSYELTDPDQNWQFKLQPARVRAFVEAKKRGLSSIGGHVETRQLPLQTSFHLLVRESEVEQIEAWGKKSCENFEEVSYAGLPDSWKLYRSDGASNDRGVHGDYDVLSQPRETQITLDGGVRVQPRTNEYFVFAPPSIRVRGSEAVDVYLNDVKLDEADGELYPVPKQLQSEGEYTVSAKEDGETIKRKYFFLQSHTSWKEISSISLDKFGFAQNTKSQDSDDSEWEIGETNLENAPLNLLPDIFLGSESKVYLVGSTPGQVAEWTAEGLPDDWQAVWAILKDGQAYCCWPGDSPPQPKPVPKLNRVGGLRYSRSKISDWKEVLYYWRKRTKPPERHGELWRKYRTHAKEEC